jgi:hypothetical protein
MSLSTELAQLQTAVTSTGTAIHAKDSANSTAISNEATTRQNADTALGAQVGSQRGLVSIKTGASTLPADPWGYVYQTDAANTTGALSTALPAALPANAGKRMVFENTSAFNWTLTASNILSSQSNGASSLVLAPGTTAEIYHDGASYLVEGGTYVSGGNGKTTVSAASPSGGANGDTWYQV